MDRVVDHFPGYLHDFTFLARGGDESKQDGFKGSRSPFSHMNLSGSSGCAGT
jgi:hypothetical protein